MQNSRPSSRKKTNYTSWSSTYKTFTKEHSDVGLSRLTWNISITNDREHDCTERVQKYWKSHCHFACLRDEAAYKLYIWLIRTRPRTFVIDFSVAHFYLFYWEKKKYVLYIHIYQFHDRNKKFRQVDFKRIPKIKKKIFDFEIDFGIVCVCVCVPKIRTNTSWISIWNLWRFSWLQDLVTGLVV